MLNLVWQYLRIGRPGRSSSRLRARLSPLVEGGSSISGLLTRLRAPPLFWAQGVNGMGPNQPQLETAVRTRSVHPEDRTGGA
jgi:hypothetical protein